MAYHLTLPLARHERLRDFRGLVLGTHPLIPIGSAVRAGLNRVAVAVVDGGAPRRMAQSTAAEAAVLSTKFLFSGWVAGFPVEAYEQLRARAAGLSAEDQSLDAARLRGMVFSHRHRRGRAQGQGLR